MSVEESANCLIDITVELVPAGFELRRDSFTLTNQFQYLVFIDVHSWFLFIYNQHFGLVLWRRISIAHLASDFFFKHLRSIYIDANYLISIGINQDKQG